MIKEKGLFKLFFLLFTFMSMNVFAQPIIYSHPVDTAVCEGVTIEFEVVASNVSVYQWQENDGSGWFDINESNVYASGENTSVLTISDAITGLNNYQYRCYLESSTGESLISNPATLNVYEHPIISQDPINTTVCKNETALFYVDAENVTEYKWQENRGTGWYDLIDNSFYSGTTTSSLEIYTIFGISDYQYRCKVFNESCYDISAAAVLIVNPIPLPYYVSGGGEICENESGVEISLLGSAELINYELFRNAVSTGMFVEGTGSPISFGFYDVAGTYTVRAINPSTSCVNEMTGIAVVEVNEAPEIYSVIGSGSYCSGSSGTEIFLESSQIDIVYELFLNGNHTGYVILGTGGVVSFNNIHTEGSYSIRATNQQTACTALMDGVITIVEHPAPIQYQLSGGGAICEGQGNGEVILDGSDIGIKYYLLKNNQLTSQIIDGTGDVISFDNIFDEGVYSVRAKNIASGCETMMSGYVELNYISLPEIFNLSGNGFICPGGFAVVTLGSSETGVDYYLYLNGNETSCSLPGTGDELVFSGITTEGTYKIFAVNQSSGCSVMMNQQVEVQNASSPVANAGNNQNIDEGTITSLTGSATGGSAYYSYYWSPEGLLDNPEISNPVTVPMNNSQLFTLTVLDNNSGCLSEKDTVIITVQTGVLSVTAYASQETVCNGETINLFALAQGGSGMYSFSWFTTEGVLIGNGSNTVVQPSVTTKYVVKVDDSNIIKSDTIEIFVGTIPEIFSLSGESFFCQGDEGSTLQLSGSEIGTSYQLRRNGIDINDVVAGSGDAIDFSANMQGAFSVVSYKEGCEQLMDGTVDVEKKPIPNAFAGSDFFIGYGDNAQLNGTAFGNAAAYSYEWFPSEYLQNSTVEDPLSSPLTSSMKFSLRVTDAEFGCVSKPDSVLVTVSDMPLEIEITTSASEICPGSSVTISAVVNGDSDDFNYMWYSNPPGFFAETQTITTYPAIDTWYYVVADNGQYQVNDSVFISLAVNPDLYEVSGGGSMCSNSNGVEIQLSGSQNSVYYSLYCNDANVNNVVAGTGNAISFGNIAEQGTYFVVATSNESNCSQNMNGTTEIYSVESPQAFAGENVTINNNESALLNGYGFGGSGEFSYHWSPADKVVNSTLATTSTINLSFSEMFFLEVTDQNSGCVSLPDTVLVNVAGSTITASIQATPSSICSGETVALRVIASGGTGNYSYSWTSSPEGFSSSVYNPIVSPQHSTLYSVQISDGENIITKSVQVIVNESPVANAGEDIEVYYGESAILQGGASGGSGNYSYLWNPQGLIVNENTINATTVSLFNKQSFYFAVADLETGCTSVSDEVVVDIKGSDLNVNVTAVPGEVCSGQLISLFALPDGGTENYSFQWRSEPEGFYSDQFYTSAVINQDMKFFVTVSDGEYQMERSVNVSVRPSPQKFDFSGDGIYCVGESGTTLNLSGSEEEVTYQLLYNNVSNGVSASGNGNILNFEEIKNEGIYSVKAVNQSNMCSALMRGAVQVEKSALPQQFNVFGGGVFCEGDEAAAISLENSEFQTSYTLYKDGEVYLDPVNGTGSQIVFDNTADDGSYYVVARNEAGCTAQMSSDIIISTMPLPDVYTSDDTTIYAGESALLQAFGATTYLWNTTPAITAQTVTVSPSVATTYTVTGMNENGCSAQDDVTVYVNTLPEPDANAFTPDGDGVNDVFLQGYKIKVFNKWGVILYEGDQGWDGTYEGSPVNSGSYFYLRISDKLGEEINAVKGTVSVIRQ
ncbi:MAG: gliding motility-associated C-terminal domain-containing protein [Bacteroidota bacterium]|nr:gliding motility-associated C-terminal domain-containing protein [Bacteroidota bacterium]